MMTDEKLVAGITDVLYNRLGEIIRRLEELHQDKEHINPHDFYSGFWRGTDKALREEQDFLSRLITIIQQS